MSKIKPVKPPGCPLFPHPSGRWARKYKDEKDGKWKFRYYGPWDDLPAALARYEAEISGVPIESNSLAEKKKRGKPWPGFPLGEHRCGQYVKRIRGKLEYFGRIDAGPHAAEAEYQRVKEDLYAGRPRRPAGGSQSGLTVDEGLNAFLNFKSGRLDSGELSQRTLDDYTDTCRLVRKYLGATTLWAELGPIQIEGLRAKLAKTHRGPTLAHDITVVRMVFRWIKAFFKIDVDLGVTFKKPPAIALRRIRNEKGIRMFSAGQMRKILRASRDQPTLRAMILLAINCAFSNADCAALAEDALDLENGWVRFSREKTAMPRTCCLWPETREALRTVLAQRRQSNRHEDRKLVFITLYGNPWQRTKANGCPISKSMYKLLQGLGIYRPGLNFGALRHTFRTVAGRECAERDIDICMGHDSERRDPQIERIMGSVPAQGDVSAAYREKVWSHRLRKVAKAVRKWLYRRRKNPSTLAVESPSAGTVGGLPTPAA